MNLRRGSGRLHGRTGQFSDLHMPGMGGRQLTEQLLAHDPAYEDRLILFTGAVEPADMAGIRERTGVPILHKPFGVDDITRVIAAAEGKAI